MRRLMIKLMIVGWVIYGVPFVLIPILSAIIPIGWRADPPLFYVEITPFTISTAGTDFPYWMVGTLLLGIPVFILTAIVSSTRRLCVPGDPCCPKCRYDLTGNMSGVCPECGTPITTPVPRAPSPRVR